MILVTLLLPLPTLVLDLLLVLNVSLALLILLFMFYLHRPLEFSSFPSLLLILTLFRLSLNVASTKLILLDADAGNVIQAFGEFVVGNNYVVGAVVFVILVIIQFLVITKGAGRIAEVAARFTLDAMPGKQMSIDADLNAGIIDEEEAKSRRAQLGNETEFYGAMDGASKFVKGDAIAGVAITLINIIGGLAIGIFQRKMPALAALQTFTVLTIGDGLVSQIPALIISVSAGILVTRVADSDRLGTHISQQLLKRPEPFILCGVTLCVLALLPGLPLLQFGTLGIGSLSLGLFLVKHPVTAKEGAAGAAPKGIEQAGEAPGKALPRGEQPAAERLPRVNPMCVEIGFGLITLVNQSADGNLVDRIGMIRDQIQADLGYTIPPISVQDNLDLGNNEYRVLVRGLERARGTVQVGSYLAINPGDVTGAIEGVRTKDPAFGFDAVWINPRRIEAAEAKGYTVVECPSVITTHVTEVVMAHAADLLSRQAVSDLVELLKESDKAVVEELVPKQLSIGVVHRVLQYLLNERVPIHDLPAILETMADYAGQTKDPLTLCEFCRQALRGHIVSRIVSDTGVLHALILAPETEQELKQALGPGGSGLTGLDPHRVEQLVDRINEATENVQARTDAMPALIVAPGIRPHLYRLIERRLPELAVLSFAEVADDVNLQLADTVRIPEPALQELAV
jgi:flagellar biosynthesis protein FlhA